MNYCGRIEFGGHYLNVYNNLEDPIFQAVEVARLVDYSTGNTWTMLQNVEHDEKILLNTPSSVRSIPKRGNPNMWFITELGLYNVLSQSRKPIARQWRRIVHKQLIQMRIDMKRNIVDQFADWDAQLDDIFFDEETGMLMETWTIPGGDVEIVPYGRA